MIRWMRLLLASALKFTSPRYIAVTVWQPLAMVLVVNVAWPRVRFGVPISTPSTRISTAPDGRPAPGATAVTFTVNVTFVQNKAGLPLVAMIARLVALFTVWVNVALVLGPKLTAPG